ncbi:prostatic acid phosphatase-like [Clytia hemisphaerica]|uniref:acid phosphatase n=1 Tax=Clytia hemisphaerica TaxID=252671 RepID=A0A7M5VA51_9CNID
MYYHQNMIGWLCSVFVILASIFQNINGDTLKMSNILYRHGARSPTRFYPTNPNQVTAWPDGAGRLSQVGMNMEYHLGKFLKERYVDTKFINQSYLHKEVSIRSSSVDRCLQSAQAQLAGLYPPSGWQIWGNEELGKLWQPIPVQTVPGDEDPLLRPEDTDCPRIGEIWSSMTKASTYIQKAKDNKELLDYMTKNSGKNITLSNILFDVTDDLLCERAEGLKSAQWAIDRFPDILELTYWAFNYLYQGSDELGRLLGGALLGKMVGNMKTMASGDTDDSLSKLNIFSGHDTSILSFTTALNTKFPVPEFAACILVELYETPTGDHYVTINYRNGFGNITLTPMNLTGCDVYQCPLDDFVRITSKRIPTNRHKECNPVEPFFTKKNLTVIAAVLLATTIFLFFLFIWMLVRSRYRKTYIRSSLKKKAQQDSEDNEKNKRRHERGDESENKAINDTEDENAALIV